MQTYSLSQFYWDIIYITFIHAFLQLLLYKPPNNRIVRSYRRKFSILDHHRYHYMLYH